MEGDALPADETAAVTAEGKSAAKSVAALAATRAATPVAPTLALAGQVKEGSKVKGADAGLQEEERAQVNLLYLFNRCLVKFFWLVIVQSCLRFAPTDQRICVD